MKKVIWIALILLLCITTTGFGEIRKEIEKSFDVSSGGELVIKSDLGSIEVDTHSKETVEVKVLIRFRTSDEEKAEEIMQEIDIDFMHKGSDVSIRCDFDHGWSGWGGNSNKIRMKYQIIVPAKYNLDLSTSGGSISVKDITGFVKSRTSGGSLSFANIDGEVLGNTSGGSIKLESCTGDAKVSTSGGGIQIGEVKGIVEASTSGGGIRVKEVAGTVNASTSGGGIDVYISKQPEGDCKLKTSGGGITVTLAEDIALYLDAKTSGGSVDSEFPVEFRGKVKKSRLAGEINGGGPELYLRTSGGGITIYKK